MFIELVGRPLPALIRPLKLLGFSILCIRSRPTFGSFEHSSPEIG